MSATLKFFYYLLLMLLFMATMLCIPHFWISIQSGNLISAFLTALCAIGLSLVSVIVREVLDQSHEFEGKE